MKKRVTPEALADMLMKRVYVPFSAVVSAAADGEILSLCQFDTAFAGEQMAFDERAAEVSEPSPGGASGDDCGGRGQPEPPAPPRNPRARPFFPRRGGYRLCGG